jgi:hypothetical protein
MNKNLVRDLAILGFLLAVAFLAKMELINAIIAVWIGIWVMVKLFKPFFRSEQNAENLSEVDFIPNPRHIIFNLLFTNKRKSTLFVMIWWISGIGIMVVTYQIITALFISP